MDVYYIIAALSVNDIRYYISNTSPILWDNSKNNAKKFDTFLSAKNDLEDNYISLANTISNSDISSLWIIKICDGEEVKQKQIL